MSAINSISLREPATQLSLGVSVTSLIMGVALHRLSKQVHTSYCRYGAYAAFGVSVLSPVALLASKGVAGGLGRLRECRPVKHGFSPVDMKGVQDNQETDLVSLEFASGAGVDSFDYVPPIYTLVFPVGAGKKAFDIRELASIWNQPKNLGTIGLVDPQVVEMDVQRRNEELKRLVNESGLASVVSYWGQVLSSSNLTALTDWVNGIEDLHVRDLVRWAPVQMKPEEAPVTPELPIGVCLGLVEDAIADKKTVVNLSKVRAFLDLLATQLDDPLSLAK